MRVLIVKNSQPGPNHTLEGLASFGVQVDVTSTTAKAIVFLGKSAFDVILLEMSSFNSDALPTLNMLKAAAGDVPIVVSTSNGGQDLGLEAVRNGAQSCHIANLADDRLLFYCLQSAIERNKVEQVVQRSERNLRTILDNSFYAFISTDAKLRIVDWNAEAERTFGWTKKEALGQSLALIVPSRLGAQYRRDVAGYFSKNKASIVKKAREIIAIHRDGHEFPVEIGIVRFKNGVHSTFCAFVRDIADIRESKEALERRVEKRTVELTRSNDELKQFAKITSHDLQEPLRAVRGFAVLLAEGNRGKLDHDSLEFIDYILDGTERMEKLIKDVLVHSKVGRDASTNYVTSCESVVEEVLVTLHAPIKKAEASLQIDRLPLVAVERSQLIQLFQNLISNAIKYRGSGQAHVSLSAERSGDEWLFSLRDNGIGIDPKYSDKIFDMFARLHGKTEYSGTGMGLAICKKVVTSHGGSIWVESEPGVGSIFLFTLPAVKENQGEGK